MEYINKYPRAICAQPSSFPRVTYLHPSRMRLCHFMALIRSSYSSISLIVLNRKSIEMLSLFLEVYDGMTLTPQKETVYDVFEHFQLCNTLCC